MAFDFPNSPTVGQVYPSPAIAGAPQYSWDGTKWVISSATVGAVRPPPTTRTLIGNITYNPPAGCTLIEVRYVGAGGGGAGITNGTPGTHIAGTVGGDSSFGGIVAKGGSPGLGSTGNPNTSLGGGAGGTGGAGTATLREPGGPGGSGGTYATAIVSPPGGSSYFSGGTPAVAGSSGSGTNAAANSGAGGSGAVGGSTNFNVAASGGGGEFVYLLIPNPAASYAWVQGLGGAGGVGGNFTGGAGANAQCFIVEYYGSTVVDNIGSVRWDIAQALTAAQQAQARANIAIQRKNYIVNGAMMISQENGTTAVTGDGSYAADEWANRKSTAGSGTNSLGQVVVNSPAGSPNRLRCTVTAAQTSVGASDFFHIQNRVEGQRVADLRFGLATAKTITIQFGCKGPAGIYCVTVLNLAGNRSYVAEYTIAAGEANTDVVKSVTIPGDVTGTWTIDNSLGFDIRWGLMAGSSVVQAAGSWGTGNVRGSANQFNLFSTNGNIFELFDVGLYEGNVAPPFMVPDYVSELALCRRYFLKLGGIANAYPYLYGYAGIASAVFASNITFPTQMRVNAPTIAKVGTWTLGNCSQPGVGNQSSDGMLLFTNSTAAGNLFAYPADATCYLTANARM